MKWNERVASLKPRLREPPRTLSPMMNHVESPQPLFQGHPHSVPLGFPSSALARSQCELEQQADGSSLLSICLYSSAPTSVWTSPFLLSISNFHSFFKGHKTPLSPCFPIDRQHLQTLGSDSLGFESPSLMLVTTVVECGTNSSYFLCLRFHIYIVCQVG